MNIHINCQGIYDIESKQRIYSEILVRKYGNISGLDNIMYWAYKDKKYRELDEDIIDYSAGLIRTMRDTEQKYAFNICGETLKTYNEAHRIISILNKHEVKDRVMIEVTEKTDFENSTVIENIKELSSSGIKIILDDFGKENSNIEALMNIKFDIVKLDKNYIKQAVCTRRQLEILAGVINMLDNLNILTVVEGVETLDQLQTVKNIGATAVQGYYLEKPKHLGYGTEVQKNLC